MSPAKKSQGLPTSDGTTSTNYGPSFEISSTAIAVLRACKRTNDFTCWINYKKYEPWDDIVLEIHGKILIVQLKHNEKFEKKKLEYCLQQRRVILDKYPSEKDRLVFIYFATTPDDAIRNNSNYQPVESIPDFLNLFLTSKGSIYYDSCSTDGETYFCMNQHNISTETVDIKQALVEYVGQQYEDPLKDVQIRFVDYLRKRYLRLINDDDPLTKPEVCKLLGYAILNKYKAEYKQSDVKGNVASDFEKIMELSSLVVFDHRWSSSFKENIWFHLLGYLEKRISKKHLKQSKLDDLWMEGKLHMPIVSASKDSDKTILRALEIAGFEPKVLILRPRVFTIKEEQDTITLLQNLTVANSTLLMQTDQDQETFKYAEVNLNDLLKNKSVKLHQDAFCKIAKDYFKGENEFPKCIVEAHDEQSYVNDANVVGDETMPALFAAIRIKQIDIKIIQHILQLGANVNASINGGFRPVFFAIDANRPDILEFLLQSGASPDPADKHGIRPLFNACIQNKPDMVELLVKYKADRSAADVDGVRPLFMAYASGNFEIMRTLLKDFDKPAAANTQGSHILHRAAEDGKVECLKCILECCPNIKIFMTGDVLGKTPLDIARENGSQEFVELLSKALEK